MSEDATIKLNAIFGSVEIISWLAPQADGSLVGMGRCIERDRDGNVVKDESSPTGVVLRFG